MPEHDEIPMMMEREAGCPEQVPEVGVGFGLVPQENGRKSSAAGHPVFEEREYVKIVIPGDKQSLYFQPATDQHKRRFPRAYAMFKARETQAGVEGMPIEHWPQITRALALTFKACNIPTVEALAAVHDGHVEKLGNEGREWRAKAKAFLDIAKDTAASQKLAAESERKDLMISDLQRQINDLAARLSDEPQKRGPGRPPKAQAA
jgi:hypothetical protein